MQGQLRFNEPLTPYSSWRVGGAAERYFCPQNIQQLSDFLQSLPAHEPLLWLGLASNVLIRDGGIPGTVIHLLPQAGLNGLQYDAEQNWIRAEAGVAAAKFSRFCAKNNFSGGEFFSGIPGTIGGALAMNAGAFGAETWDFVVQLETMDRWGQRRLRLPADYQVAYREVLGPKEEWFLAGYFHFPPVVEDIPSTQTSRIKALLKQRSASQPIGVYSGGSVFKNPPGDFAGRLIEASNLKGFAIGGARVSEKHANFIINEDQAKAQDIEEIIDYVREQVWQQQQVQLQLEVRVLGLSD